MENLGLLNLCSKLTELGKKMEETFEDTYIVSWDEWIKCGPNYELMSRAEYLRGNN